MKKSKKQDLTPYSSMIRLSKSREGESRSRTSPSNAMRHLLRTNPLPGLP